MLTSPEVLGAALQRAEIALEAAVPPFDERVAATAAALIDLIVKARAVGPGQGFYQHLYAFQLDSMAERFIDESIKGL